MAEEDVKYICWRAGVQDWSFCANELRVFFFSLVSCVSFLTMSRFGVGFTGRGKDIHRDFIHKVASFRDICVYDQVHLRLRLLILNWKPSGKCEILFCCPLFIDFAVHQTGNVENSNLSMLCYLFQNFSIPGGHSRPLSSDQATIISLQA